MGVGYKEIIENPPGLRSYLHGYGLRNVVHKQLHILYVLCLCFVGYFVDVKLPKFNCLLPT